MKRDESELAGHDAEREQPDFAEPVYPLTVDEPRPAGDDPASPDLSGNQASGVAGEPIQSMPVRVAAGIVAGVISGQGVARFAEMVLEGVGIIPDQHVPLLIAIAAGLLCVLPIAASALLASRGSRYALGVGMSLAVVVAILGRIGAVDLAAVLLN